MTAPLQGILVVDRRQPRQVQPGDRPVGSGTRAVVHALPAQAEVLIENFRPGVMQRLGLIDDDLAQRFRRKRPAEAS